MTADLGELERLVREALPWLEEERRVLIESYAHMPVEGAEHDPETISDRWAYESQKEYGGWIDRARSALLHPVGDKTP